MINVSKLYCGLAGQSDQLRYEHGEGTGPVVVYNCTSRCNLRCLHCYSSSGACHGDSELSTRQARSFLALLPQVGCPVVLFSGGEPLLREDLFELLGEAKGLGLRTVLSTNGTLIDARAAERLAEAAVSYVGISIDGREEFHDKFRQKKGCFAAAMRGIESCRQAGLRTGLRFTITAENAEQIEAAFDIAADSGTRRICFYHLIRSGRAVELEDQALSSQQTRRVVETIIDKTDDFVGRGVVDEVLTVGNHADGPFILVTMERQQREGLEQARRLLTAAGGNRIGQGIVCVGWDGQVYADQFWRNYSLGNVKDRKFAEIWTDEQEPVLAKLRNRDEFADERCLVCKWFYLCKGNYRFLGEDPAAENWLNEPACYLTDEEIGL